jgi:drug/metabolite transporter (DMT)-like permease
MVDFLLLAAIWGASFMFMRTATVELGAVPTAAVRVAIAALALLPLLVWRGQMPALRQHWKPVLWVGMLNSGIPFALFSFALLSITTGLSAILNATTPLFGTLIAWLWLKDRPNASRSLGLVIGFIGVALLAWDKASFKPDSHGIAPGWAVLACLLAATCYGITGSYTKRFLSKVPPLVIATGSQIGAALGLALPALWWWPAQWPSAQAWGALLVVGVVCTALAYTIFFRLIANIGPAKALTVTFVVPVFAVLYGAVFLGEALTPWMLGCGLVVVCGTALATGLLRLPVRH